MAASGSVMKHIDNKCLMQSRKDLCEKLLEDIDKTLEITRLTEEQEDIGMNTLENEHYFSPPVVNLDRFKFRKLTPDSPTGKCIDADTPSYGEKYEAGVKNFYNEQILFYQKELENKQKVIDSLLLLLHESSKITTRDEQKRPLQKSNTFVKNSIETQTNESVILTIQDDDNRLNFIDIDQVNKRETNKGNNSTKQDDSNQLNLTSIVQDSNNKSVEKQLEDYKVFSATKLNRSKEEKNQLKDIRQLHKVNYVTYKLNIKKSLQNRLEKLANYELRDRCEEANHNSIIKTTDAPLTVTTTPSENTVCIIGDSMLKDVKSWTLKEKIVNVVNVNVKCFPGATIGCMADYIRPTLKKSPNNIILHVGTNDLKTKKTPIEIAHSTIELAKSTGDCKTAVSSIITRGDGLKQKAKAVNSILGRLCSERNIGFINNDNINIVHLNGSKLHLQKKGSKLLLNNFATFIDKL